MKEILPNIRVPNLKTQVYDLLLKLIVDGKYKDDDKLPSEKVLCEKFGVSRTVVREAVKSLETRGILKVIHGKGIEVCPSTNSDISNAFMLFLKRQKQEVPMRDLLEVRYAIEIAIAKLAAVNPSKENIDKLCEIIQKMKGSISDVENFIKLDLQYHLQIAYSTKNIIFITIMEALIVPMRKSREETVSPEDNVQSLIEHINIYNSIKSKDSKKAKYAMKKHLKHVKDVLASHGKL